ncbi:MAG: GNAT family N-acetyltransferase [Oscillospiraceae bacterium]
MNAQQMEIRSATAQDIPALADNRLEFVTLLGGLDDAEAFRTAVETYLNAHISDGALITRIAVENGEIVSSCILSVYTVLPTRSNLQGKTAVLYNVYTKQAYRRKGLAQTLLRELIDEARAAGVGKILLDYTSDGYPLYQKLGFSELAHQMELNLD